VQTAVLVARVVVAAFAGWPSTWSRGVSMLSSIHPPGERSRNSRWGLTLTAYLVASVVGGALMGSVAGGIGSLMEVALAPSATAAVIARVGRAHLPQARRFRAAESRRARIVPVVNEALATLVIAPAPEVTP
jgi:hypothetical protein